MLFSHARGKIITYLIAIYGLLCAGLLLGRLVRHSPRFEVSALRQEPES